MKVWEFPAFHWLRLHTFIAKGIVQSLVRELKSHQPLSVTKKKKKKRNSDMCYNMDKL